jgi:hypothetical protein
MAAVVPHLLFTLERYDRAAQAVRSVGGVIIAMEDPVYVGRLLVGSTDVDDKSALIVPGTMARDLFGELQQIAEHPGREVTKDTKELWALFSDPEMTERETTAAFSRHGRYTSFVRRTDRYERILREFVQDLAGREAQGRQA